MVLKPMNILLTTAVIIAASQQSTIAEENNYGDKPNVEYIYNYDGDTINVNIPDYPDIIGKNIPVRLRHIDTPEISGTCPEEIAAAETARDFVTAEISTAEIINLKNIGRDKYFRILANVEYDGKDLATKLLDNGYALPYEGTGDKPDWCSILN